MAPGDDLYLFGWIWMMFSTVIFGIHFYATGQVASLFFAIVAFLFGVWLIELRGGDSL